MKIEQEIKLDFKDVLFRPKRSTLSSRSEVNLERTFTFKNSGKTKKKSGYWNNRLYKKRGKINKKFF